MATTYTVELLNPEQTEVKDAGVLSYTGAATAIPATLNQVSPKGTITSGALPTVTLVSGTGSQFLTTRDVSAYLVVTNDDSNNVASATIDLSPDNVTYSTIGVVSQVAAVNDAGAVGQLVSVRVPAGWYLKVTLVHMTASAATYA